MPGWGASLPPYQDGINNVIKDILRLISLSISFIESLSDFWIKSWVFIYIYICIYIWVPMIPKGLLSSRWLYTSCWIKVNWSVLQSSSPFLFLVVVISISDIELRFHSIGTVYPHIFFSADEKYSRIFPILFSLSLQRTDVVFTLIMQIMRG